MTNHSKKSSKTNKQLLKSKCYKKTIIVKFRRKTSIIMEVLDTITLLFKKSVHFINWLIILIFFIYDIFFIIINQLHL